MKNLEISIGKLINKQKICYLSSVDINGFPNTKVMLSPRKREGISAFYFSTNTSSMKVSQFEKNPNACVYFCDKRFFHGVMLVGRIEILMDLESKKSIWQIGDTLYYPKGISDPDYCVLKFTASSRRYYSSFKSESFEI